MNNSLKTVLIFFLAHFFVPHVSLGQNDLKVYPTNWWVGMKNPNLQLMVHQENIAAAVITLDFRPGVQLTAIRKVKNPNYVFIDLLIGNTTSPGDLIFRFNRSGNITTLNYALKKRIPGNGTKFAQGVRSPDLIYLIMPDRFSNGDVTNDRFAGMLDTSCDRSNPLLRHGGDLQGITNHLDYLKELGVTALWLCPVIENDMPLQEEKAGMMSGYHGYWFTDHYTIDKRLGGSDAYHRMVEAAHARGLKVIQDAVYNHIGDAHIFMKDLPEPDWVNQWPSYQNTNHREGALIDIHAAAIDKKIMTDGWFVPHLPDLNLRNPYLARFLIQNAVWMTETFRLDGWRVDTYKYCDEQFLIQLNKTLASEYPSLSNFGEVTTGLVAAAAYFCENNILTPIKHNGQGVTDYPLTHAMLAALQKPGGVDRVYETLSQDLLYRDPQRNCIFLDNHDMNRLFSESGEDLPTFEMGIGLLLTLRGVPQLYYGTEILMKNFMNPSDAWVREDFPGGFPGDSVNKFISAGRTAEEEIAFRYIQSVARFRKTSTALGTGKLLQYVPDNGLYVYFRYDAKQTIMCVLNTDSVTRLVDCNRFRQGIGGFQSAREISTGQHLLFTDRIEIPARKMWILELK
jgi:neopullulanase